MTHPAFDYQLDFEHIDFRETPRALPDRKGRTGRAAD